MAKKYTVRYKSKTKLWHLIWLTLAVAVLCVLSLAVWGYSYYKSNLGPVSADQTTQIFTVKPKQTMNEIADGLAKQKLIKSAWAMEIYARANNLSGSLQAGTYALSPSQGTKEIVKILGRGKVSSVLVTILPGRRVVDQVRADLINYGFTPSDVDSALLADQYRDMSILSIVPKGNNLEGMLWPESFDKAADTPASQIVRQSLMQMQLHITPDVVSALKAQGLTAYQGIILASIVNKEVNKPADQAQAAQVFLTRMKDNMMLGSDVTALYGSITSGHGQDLTYDSPYNTLIHTGLPPTPIGTISASSLAAVEHPASTNWLYFVTGDNGTTYFSTNIKDHQALTAKYCHKLCGL